MMYKYYSCIVFNPIKHNEEGKDIYNVIFNNIPHFIKTRLRVDFIQDGFVMYKDKVLIHKRLVITPIPDSITPTDCCKKTIIYFTTDDITSNFELFSKNTMDDLYLTEIKQIDWLHMLYEDW